MTIPATATEIQQLEDARRGCLVAAAALRCLAGEAIEGELLRAAQRVHGTLTNLSEELADLQQRSHLDPNRT